MIKKILTAVLLLTVAFCVNARVKYTDEMKSFIGTWTHQDKAGNDCAYRFYVSDGWLIIRYKYVDHFYEGTELEGVTNTNMNVDYTYSNGSFHYDRNYPHANNSITLRLKEGSLVETNSHSSWDEDNPRKVYKATYEAIYDLDF